MRTVTLAFALASVAPGYAQDCAPPPAITERLTAVLKYENGLARNERHPERFSFLRVGDLSYVRQNTVPESYDPKVRPVWVFDANVSSVGWPETLCPADTSWVDCAIRSRGHSDQAAGGATGSHSPSMSPHVCEFTLNVPRWEPSLDDPEKRKIAAELVAEFQKFGYADAKQIVIRDLNLDDPEVTARITGSRDDEEFQGCTFVRQTLPHCTWHLFGQSPRESLRRELMKRPYQIYPRLP